MKRPHYLPATTQVEGGGGRIELELQRPPATLHVTSAPPGAAVRVDGSPAGQTPLDVTVTAYKHHRVDIEHDGAIVRRTVYLRPPSGAIDVALRAARP